MKYLLIIIAICLVSCSNSTDNSEKLQEWEFLDYSLTENLTDVEFLNDDFGIISGCLGTLLKTTNGGDTWEKLDVGINHSFLKVFALNENEFFTSRIGLYKTNDNGGSFDDLGGLSEEPGSIFSIHFFNSDNGLICKGGRILKTTNAGENWQEVYNSGFASNMQFVSESVGFISGGITYDSKSVGEMYKTTDGGNNWNKIEIDIADISAMDFINENTGYIAMYDNSILKTTDGGNNWDLVSNTPMLFCDIIFLNEKTGYGVGANYIYSTTNGGKTWAPELEDNDIIFTSITKTPNNTVYTVTDNGHILRKLSD